jgi:hypothetical protein
MRAGNSASLFLILAQGERRVSTGRILRTIECSAVVAPEPCGAGDLSLATLRLGNRIGALSVELVKSIVGATLVGPTHMLVNAL